MKATYDVRTQTPQTPDISYLSILISIKYRTQSPLALLMPTTTSALRVTSLTNEDRLLLAVLLLSIARGHIGARLKTIERCKSLTPSPQLNREIIEHLRRQQLISEPENGFVYLHAGIKNSDAEISNLLSHHEPERLDEYVIKWTRKALAAECMTTLSYIAKRRGIEITEPTSCPKRMTRLINERPTSEIKMLIWQAIANLHRYEFRLLNLNLNEESQIECILDTVFKLHQQYARKEMTVSRFNMPVGYQYGSLVTTLALKYWCCTPEELEQCQI